LVKKLMGGGGRRGRIKPAEGETYYPREERQKKKQRKIRAGGFCHLFPSFADKSGGIFKGWTSRTVSQCLTPKREQQASTKEILGALCENRMYLHERKGNQTGRSGKRGDGEDLISSHSLTSKPNKKKPLKKKNKKDRKHLTGPNWGSRPDYQPAPKRGEVSNS